MKITIDGGKKISAHFDGFDVKTDLSIEQQGENTAPSPYDLFLASMGCCAGIFIKNYCDQRNLSAENIKLTQDIEWSEEDGRIGKIITKIHVPKNFPESHEIGLIRVTNYCKVKKQLHPDIEAEVSIVRV